jgi:hypothetical protein
MDTKPRKVDVEDVFGLDEASGPAQPAPKKKQYIMYSKLIDKHTQKRTRVLLTDAVCNICGLDLASRNGIEDFEKLDPSEKASLKEAVAKHKEIVHSPSAALILDEDQVPKSWHGVKEHDRLKEIQEKRAEAKKRKR